MERLIASREQFLAYIQRRVGSRVVAEDILQSAFVRGVQRGGEIRDSESVVAWFYRVLGNAVIDHHRHNAVESRGLEEWAKELEVQVEPSPDSKHEICGCVNKLLSELKPEYQSALKSVEMDEASLKEYAESSGITAENAAVRVHRARQALLKQVRNTCGACAEHMCVDCNCRHD
ncbi:MAG: DNA-directed polymerase specialized sigma subunit, sigma24-like protein [Acidobacteriales bacterium]|nr:DNA-directed polymerase specialized sigma subunit, sigma24-like protein [Terriglobales bacterium]